MLEDVAVNATGGQQLTGEVDPLAQEFQYLTPPSFAEKGKARSLARMRM